MFVSECLQPDEARFCQILRLKNKIELVSQNMCFLHSCGGLVVQGVTHFKPD
jgi:hypothetical protein